MLIPVPTGDCRTAVLAALASFQGNLEADRTVIRDRSFNALFAGAIHNGLTPSQADLDQMNKMADNDVEHTMEQHPAKSFIEHLTNQIAMLDYAVSIGGEDDFVVIDDADFRLLKKHLPAKSEVLSEGPRQTLDELDPIT